MSRKRNPVTRRVLCMLSLCFFKLTGLLPLCAARLMAAAFAWTAYHVVPRIKKVGRENLDLAYGAELTDVEKDRILRDSVKNLALVAVEFSRVPRIARGSHESYVEVKGLEHVDPSTGAVLIGAHLGNWEWMPPVIASLGWELIVVVREFDDPKMNAAVDRTRRAGGVKTIAKNAALGPLLRKLREGCHAGLLVDQNPRDNGTPVRFFGKQTWATVGPALMAMRAKAPLHPVSITRNPDGKYTLEFFPALPLRHSGNTLDDLVENTQRCQDALEAMIRKHPGQWLWFHRRWKRRERLEREWELRTAKERTGAEPSLRAAAGARDAS